MHRMYAFRVISLTVGLLLFGAARDVVASSISLASPLGPAISLDQLLYEGSSIAAGDKLFDQFSYVATGNMPDASDVDVIPIVDAFGNFGLRFRGAFVDLFGYGASEALLTYRVTATLPEALISDVHLAGKLWATGHSRKKPSLVKVTETFLPIDDAMLSIFDVSPGPSRNTDFAFLTTPVKTLDVQKDILAIARSSHKKHHYCRDCKHKGAGLWYIDQTFSQILVPEPSTITLLIVGFAAMWGLCRKGLRRPV